MCMQRLEIWGRPIELEIVFDHYVDEEILATQKAACSLFLERAEVLLTEALPAVKQYCLENNRSEIGEDKIGNVFRFVKPKTLFIKRTVPEIRKTAILCAYKFNPDDGLAIVFKNEEFFEIGTENVII